MNNNDILRRLRFALNLNDKQSIKLFSKDPESSINVSLSQWQTMLLKQEEQGFVLCSDLQLQCFLDGFIVSTRGLREGSASQTNKADTLKEEEFRLSRNDILKKLRIALNFKEDDMLTTLEAGGSKLSKSELGAFFRKPGHKHYRACGNQVLRNFLTGLTKQTRQD